MSGQVRVSDASFGGRVVVPGQLLLLAMRLVGGFGVLLTAAVLATLALTAYGTQLHHWLLD